MLHAAQRLFTQLGSLTASPIAVLIVLLYTVIWYVYDRASLDFHAAATLATWIMTLFIQRAEHRDSQATQAKLDELLHAVANASNRMSLIDEAEPEEIERHRAAARARDRLE